MPETVQQTGIVLATEQPEKPVAIQTGIFEGITSEEYFSIPALSNSGMKDLAVSPLRFWHNWINPERQAREETAAMRLGTALHCAVLERDECFESRYACALDPADWPVCLDSISDIREWITSKGTKPKGTRKDEVVTQALILMNDLNEHVPILQEENRRFLAANAGKTILTPEEWRKVTGMTRALNNEPEVQKILANGKAEVALTAKDPETGALLKSRLDWMAPALTTDIKTFTQMRGKSINRTVTDALYYEGYLEQAYFYRHVRKLATGQPGGTFTFVFVESEEPHEVRIKTLRPSNAQGSNVYWEVAGAKVRQMIRLYAQCVVKFGVNRWITPQEDSDLMDDEIPQLSYGAFK